MKNDASDLRKTRIHRINGMLASQLKQGHEKISQRRFLALVEYTMGITRKRAREYLNVLADLGHVELYEDIIELKEILK